LVASEEEFRGVAPKNSRMPSPDLVIGLSVIVQNYMHPIFSYGFAYIFCGR